MDESEAVDDVDGVLAKLVLGKYLGGWAVLGAELEAAGDVVAEMSLLDFIAEPALPGFFEFEGANHLMGTMLKGIHSYYRLMAWRLSTSTTLQ